MNIRPFVPSDAGLTVTDLKRCVGRRSVFFTHATADVATSDFVAATPTVSLRVHGLTFYRCRVHCSDNCRQNGPANNAQIKKNTNTVKNRVL